MCNSNCLPPVVCVRASQKNVLFGDYMALRASEKKREMAPPISRILTTSTADFSKCTLASPWRPNPINSSFSSWMHLAWNDTTPMLFWKQASAKRNKPYRYFVRLMGPCVEQVPYSVHAADQTSRNVQGFCHLHADKTFMQPIWNLRYNICLAKGQPLIFRIEFATAKRSPASTN